MELYRLTVHQARAHLEKGEISHLYSIPSALIVLGGTLGAVMVTTPQEVAILDPTAPDAEWAPENTNAKKILFQVNRQQH